MKPTQAQIKEWEKRLEIGWPADPEILREWQQDGTEPEYTLGTLEVAPPPAELIARLEHYASLTRQIGPTLREIVTAWKRAEPTAALDVCITAAYLESRDDGAALWLGDALWDLLEWSTWPDPERIRALRAYERDLRSDARERARAITNIERAVDAFLDALRTDWRTFEPADYVASLRAWRKDLLAL